jgi:hypothetical protein
MCVLLFTIEHGSLNGYSRDQPEPLKNLNELAKAQLVFHSSAAEALAAVQGELEELSVAAEGDYRLVGDQCKIDLNLTSWSQEIPRSLNWN